MSSRFSIWLRFIATLLGNSRSAHGARPRKPHRKACDPLSPIAALWLLKATLRREKLRCIFCHISLTLRTRQGYTEPWRCKVLWPCSTILHLQQLFTQSLEDRHSPFRIKFSIQLHPTCFFLVHASCQTCYHPDGSVSPDSPCSPSQTQSACCYYPDYCLSNGFCFDAGANNLLSRQTYTDKTWTDNACPKYCLQGLSPLVQY